DPPGRATAVRPAALRSAGCGRPKPGILSRASGRLAPSALAACDELAAVVEQCDDATPTDPDAAEEVLESREAEVDGQHSLDSSVRIGHGHRGGDPLHAFGEGVGRRPHEGSRTGRAPPVPVTDARLIRFREWRLS